MLWWIIVGIVVTATAGSTVRATRWYTVAEAN